MGEGGNVICTGQKVRREILTHFLFLLLGRQTSGMHTPPSVSRPRVLSSDILNRTFDGFWLVFAHKYNHAGSERPGSGSCHHSFSTASDPGHGCVQGPNM